MQMIFYSMPTVAVAAIYCIWLHYRDWRVKQQLRLRERVTYMLWVMARKVH